MIMATLSTTPNSFFEKLFIFLLLFVLVFSVRPPGLARDRQTKLRFRFFSGDPRFYSAGPLSLRSGGSGPFTRFCQRMQSKVITAPMQNAITPAST